MEVTREMLDAGHSAWMRHIATKPTLGAYQGYAAIYLAMKAKELPLETVERVATIIEDKLFPIFGAGPYEATARQVCTAIASMGDDGLREALLKTRELVRKCADSGFAEDDCLALYKNNGAITAALARTSLGTDGGELP